jgi:UDP-N-acetyl-D-galactosamine dehydrogenase
MVLINLLDGTVNITISKFLTQNLNLKKYKIAIIGLGYVGLSLAIEFGKKKKVIGFDINKERVDQLKNSQDLNLEVFDNEFQEAINLYFTNNINDIKNCEIFIITLPTPVDQKKNPDLSLIEKCCIMISPFIKKDNLVIFESTVYPGATEEVFAPIIEKHSSLIFNKEFFCGYSPERVNPGDKKHHISSIVKVTSGSTPEISLKVDKLYKEIISAGTYLASSIKVAEAAKVIENIQRDINIALVNELSIIFNKLKIDTESVLDAASTKWNFLPFKPGLVGGHCIGVDPYYLAHKSLELGHQPEMILAGRKINENMAFYVSEQLKKLMIKKNIDHINSNILIMGFAFKENCPDIRNTKIADLIKEINKYNLNVDVYDPVVNKNEVKNQYAIDIIEEPAKQKYDAIILAVAHNIFLSANQIKGLGKKKHVIYDLKCLLNIDESDLRL